MNRTPAISVLLVEDDDEDAFLLRDLLADARSALFTLVRANRLASALDHLSRRAFDVVLLDLVLPDSTGIATLTAVRAQAERVPIVILSGLEDEEFKLRMVQAGAQDYLAKGKLTPDGLVRALRYAIERKRAEEALHASEERFRSAFDYAATGMGLVSQEGRWLKVNRSLCDLLGYTESELLSRTFLLSLHPKDLATHGQYLQQLQQGEIRYYQVENRFLDKAGRTKWVLLSVSLVRGADGALAYSIFQLQDITARKEAEAMLRSIAEDAEERSRILEVNDRERQGRLTGYYSNPSEALHNCLEALDWASSRRKQGAALSGPDLDYLYKTLAANQDRIRAALAP